MILLKAIKNTYNLKDVFKGKGFKWNGKDKCWEMFFEIESECKSFINSFLDDYENSSKVVFKYYEIEPDDMKTESQKEFERLKDSLMRLEEVKNVEEVIDEKRIGLKVVAENERVFWYDDIDVYRFESEIDTYEIILNEILKNHDLFVDQKNNKKIQEGTRIEFFCIPLYRFLVNKAKQLKNKNRKYYESEVEIIEIHKPENKNPVKSNEIITLRSEQG